jgi:hypothetical protein
MTDDPISCDCTSRYDLRHVHDFICPAGFTAWRTAVTGRSGPGRLPRPRILRSLEKCFYLGFSTRPFLRLFGRFQLGLFRNPVVRLSRPRHGGLGFPVGCPFRSQAHLPRTRSPMIWIVDELTKALHWVSADQNNLIPPGADGRLLCWQPSASLPCSGRHRWRLLCSGQCVACRELKAMASPPRVRDLGKLRCAAKALRLETRGFCWT